MIPTAIRWGIYASIGSYATFIITMTLFDHTASEIVGYAGFIFFLVWIYLGIRHYRDKVNGGVVSFGQAMKVGLLIIILPTILVAIGDVIFTTYIDPDYFQDYYAHKIEHYRATLSAEDLQIKMAELQAEQELFANPLLQFIIMAVFIFTGGVVCTVIAALLAKRKPALSAA